MQRVLSCCPCCPCPGNECKLVVDVEDVREGSALDSEKKDYSLDNEEVFSVIEAVCPTRAPPPASSTCTRSVRASWLVVTTKDSESLRHPLCY